MKMNRLKLYIISVLTLAALTVGQRAWANPFTPVGVGIFGYTNGEKYMYSVSSSAGPSYPRGPFNGTTKQFDSRDSDSQFNIGNNGVTRDITMTLNGWLNFANADSGTDVTTGSSFTIVFTSANYYFAGVTVTTLAGVTVSGCKFEGIYTKTLTVTIPTNTTFGSINIAIATHTPLNYCTISGIADCYIDDGVNEPVPTVTLEGKTLRQGIDYTLSYTHSTTGGSVTVTGAGDYVGSISQHFDTREPKLSDLHSPGTNIYEITSQRDLDFLARIVKGKTGTPSNDCSGLTFRQTADIAYSYTDAWNVFTEENNFTPIGGYGYSFSGTYDGQGHTISGIRVFRNGNSPNSDAGSLGLFGYVNEGTVKNVVLHNAVIRGDDNLGGLVGYLKNSTISNCYIENTIVKYLNGSADYGIIADVQEGTNTITRTYYRNCAYQKASYSAQFISDIFTLTTDSNVTLPVRTGGTVVSTSMTTYDDGITLGGTQYYTEGTSISLTYSGTVPDGYWPRFTATADINVDKTAELIDGSTLTMPGYDISVGANLLSIITYLDGDGAEQPCSNYTFITNSSGDVTLGATGKTHWYVASGDVTIDGRLTIKDSHTHLILCDGTTLTVNGFTCYDLSIYGQSQGNGALNTSSVSTISDIDCRDITINGGIVRATNSNPFSNIDNYGIDATPYTITLGWTSPANRIYASKYGCSTLKIKDGQALSDGSAIYSGSYTGDDLAPVLMAIAGKTLQPSIESGNPTAHAAKVMGEAKYVTSFYNGTRNYQLPDGAVAYTAGLVDGEVVFYRIGENSNIIPHNTAVIIVADASALSEGDKISLTSWPSSDITPHADNILQGSDGAISKPAGTVYVLGVDGGGNMAFVTFTGETIPAGKAYYVLNQQ